MGIKGENDICSQIQNKQFYNSVLLLKKNKILKDKMSTAPVKLCRPLLNTAERNWHTIVALCDYCFIALKYKHIHSKSQTQTSHNFKQVGINVEIFQKLSFI